VAIFIGEELVDVGKKPASVILDKSWLSMFGGKNDVVDKLCVSAHKNLKLVEK
jgi:hypothetical protein